MMNNVDEPIFDAEFDDDPAGTPHNPDLADQIRDLLGQQPYCILCTQGQGQPYGSLIAFAFTEDLKQLYFTTSRATRKYRLLSECQRIALVVDSRCQHQANFMQVEAVTITAKATHIESGSEFEEGIHLLKQRHSYITEFLEATSTELFRADVVRYFHVTRFQEVSQWIP